MALIKLTAIVDNISGKLNGTVFARNKGGNYMRSKSKPTNPRSLAQIAVRAAFGAIAQIWRALTPAQRHAWNAATEDYKYQNRLGDTKTLSGFALHQKLNRNLALIGLPPLTSPPSPIALTAPVDIKPTAIASPQEFDILVLNSNENLSNSHIVISATAAISPGVENFSNRLRIISVQPVDPADTYDILADYTAQFGPLVAGQKIGVAVKYISNMSGEESTNVESSTIVA